MQVGLLEPALRVRAKRALPDSVCRDTPHSLAELKRELVILAAIVQCDSAALR